MTLSLVLFHVFHLTLAEFRLAKKVYVLAETNIGAEMSWLSHQHGRGFYLNHY
ncbi:hypothetical protein VCHA50P415_20398 [Vibrio chagasii]|nr:hypothetical protein VCHA36P166_110004 [Vibrio chagasii]CAH6884730.1 hypothetical protein VCHA34P116_20099 [Vibrio chagasii]CAH6885174.1 hypothetical protein VCHA31O71_20239 [Vibrio chagasii]CAH6886295.1 hypothetical protein VCHA36O163_20390 [Vibrio chagasii]CAH6887629.1 hypothetical protein VCHA32P90_20099 [Vibrio chagasii]